MANNYKTYIALDFETTGLKPEDERITEIGALSVVVEDGKFLTTPENEVEVFDSFVTLVNPEKPISSYITELTGINNEKVKDAPTEKEAVKQLLEFMHKTTNNPIIVAQNAPFDLGFLHHASKRSGIDSKQYDFYCTRAMSAVLFPNLSHKLVDIIKMFDIELNNAHSAYDDALATLQLFAKLRFIGDNMGIDFMNKLVHHPDRDMLYEPNNKIILPLRQKK